MNRFVHTMLIGPRVTSLGLGTPDPNGVLPSLHHQVAMNDWRKQRYEDRRALWILAQHDADQAELSIARRAGIGAALQAQLVKRSARVRLVAAGKPQQVRA